MYRNTVCLNHHNRLFRGISCEPKYTSTVDAKPSRARTPKQGNVIHPTLSSPITAERKHSPSEQITLLSKKKVKTAFSPGQHNRRRNALCELRMEGANHRAEDTPGWTTGSRSWPSYLRTFRHKLYTQRLPTAYNRCRRGDTEDGEPIMPCGAPAASSMEKSPLKTPATYSSHALITH